MAGLMEFCDVWFLCFDTYCSINRSVQELGALRAGTADLLDMLLEREPETDFSLAMRADTFMDLTDWKCRRSQMFVFREGSTVSQTDVTDHIQHINWHEGWSGPSASSSRTDGNCRHVPALEKVLVPAVLQYMQGTTQSRTGK